MTFSPPCQLLIVQWFEYGFLASEKGGKKEEKYGGSGVFVQVLNIVVCLSVFTDFACFHNYKV